MQSWVLTKVQGYLRGLYINKLPALDGEWLLLDASVNQEGNDTRIYINVQTFLTNKNKTKSLCNYSKLHNDLYGYTYYYLLGGEISWAETLQSEINLDRQKIILPCLSFNWESYHSHLNNVSNFPFLSPLLAKKLLLQFNLNDLSFYTFDNKKAVIYIWDEYSHFYYIRKELLFNFLRENKLSLVWCETGSRYGEFAKAEKTLHPSFKDFKYFKVFNP